MRTLRQKVHEERQTERALEIRPSRDSGDSALMIPETKASRWPTVPNGCFLVRKSDHGRSDRLRNGRQPLTASNNLWQSVTIPPVVELLRYALRIHGATHTVRLKGYSYHDTDFWHISSGSPM